MNDDLHEAMAAEVGGEERPPLRVAWRTARRRARRRRLAVVGVPALSAAALIGGLVLIGRADRDAARAADARSCTLLARAQDGDVAIGELASYAPPRDAAEMVSGAGKAGEGPFDAPDARPLVARIRVDQVTSGPAPNEASVAPSASGVVAATVVDQVQPGSGPARLTIVRSVQSQLDDIASSRRSLRDRIAQLVDEIDELSGPLAELDRELVLTPQDDAGYAGLLADRAAEAERIAPRRDDLQQQLDDLQQRLEVLDLADRMAEDRPDFACHAIDEGDELVVALVPARGMGYRLATPGSFFVIEDGQLSPDLDALRRAVPEWDTELVEQASGMSGDQLVDLLREAAAPAGGD
ncbi:MAG: hypothetical protein KDA94_09090 [Acidimicrobiales bacterium]|nr:hypothetical protein [Acidimicrobiales bacterium]